jgi:hypothetical protein
LVEGENHPGVGVRLEQIDLKICPHFSRQPPNPLRVPARFLRLFHGGFEAKARLNHATEPENSLWTPHHAVQLAYRSAVLTQLSARSQASFIHRSNAVAGGVGGTPKPGN